MVQSKKLWWYYVLQGVSKKNLGTLGKPNFRHFVFRNYTDLLVLKLWLQEVLLLLLSAEFRRSTDQQFFNTKFWFPKTKSASFFRHPVESCRPPGRGQYLINRAGSQLKSAALTLQHYQHQHRGTVAACPKIKISIPPRNEEVTLAYTWKHRSFQSRHLQDVHRSSRS